MDNVKYGAIHGRFQPLHIEHVNELILPAIKMSKFLFIGITNYETDKLIYSSENPHRSLEENNPYSYYQRFSFITQTLNDLGIPSDKYAIIPFPISEPEKLSNYLPNETVHFITIFDDWGRKKAQVLRDYGYKVVVFFEKQLEEKKISASMVRNNLKSGDEITHLVPYAVSKLLHNPKS